jgi:hypothetical protein
MAAQEILMQKLAAARKQYRRVIGPSKTASNHEPSAVSAGGAVAICVGI